MISLTAKKRFAPIIKWQKIDLTAWKDRQFWRVNKYCYGENPLGYDNASKLGRKPNFGRKELRIKYLDQVYKP